MDATYMLHQTPAQCAKDLISHVPLLPGDILLEPFRGEGAFFNAFPSDTVKLWAEKEKGVDYTDISGFYDWVITNPPFQLNNGSKLVNSFWFLLDYYTQRAKKGIAFLANDRCFSTLTPRRMAVLKERGWALTRVIVCSIRKWRGRYFFIVLEKDKAGCMTYLTENY